MQPYSVTAQQRTTIGLQGQMYECYYLQGTAHVFLASVLQAVYPKNRH